MMEGGEYIRWANDNTTVICMIESPAGVERADEIASVAGLDALWVGHWDLTQFMGIPGQFGDRRFTEAVRRVIDTAHAHGLVCAIQPGNPEQLRQFVDMGFDVISCGGDFIVYREALAKAVANARDIMKGVRRGT
jgi:2-dehydro-3-deoxyglucarate aldolase/4-hydroxy-2-oxoheptanedioate aldolase